MKILISILLISSIGLLTNYSLKNNPIEEQSNCQCKSFFCSCNASCNVSTPSCNCGLTCSCGCSGANGGLEEAEPAGYQSLPTSSEIQNENSIAAQAYFENLETETGTTIAQYLETLSTALANEDLDTYAENAPLLEAAFKDLTETEQSTFMTWAIANLTMEN